MADDTSKIGLGNADKKTRERVAREGGKASHGTSTSKSSSTTMSRSEAGQLGAVAQPIAAKKKGGEHSHDNR